MNANSPIRLLVCLGNPGRQYQNTRHNAGWMAADQILRDSPFPPVPATWQPDRGSLQWTGLGGHSVMLLKPATYMNLSGEAVAQTLDHLRLTPPEMLVLCDDLDLPEGTLRLRQRGSSGGHRGLASILQSLQTTDFPRLRIGIGRPQPGSGIPIVEWVLAPWVSVEENLPGDAIRAAVQATDLCLRHSLAEAMQAIARARGPRRTETKRSESQESTSCPSMN